MYQSQPDGSEERLSALQIQIDELRRKLSFYEGFDQVLNESTARSAELVRLAAQRQSEADAAERSARQSMERMALDQQELFGRIRMELDSIRGAVENLAAIVDAGLTRPDTAVRNLTSQPSREVAPTPADPEPAASTQTFTLVVRGIRDVERAQSLQSHLAAIPGVGSVQPREFHHGVLRLECLVERGIELDDLVPWGGPSLEVVDRGPQALIVAIRLN